MIKAQSLKEVIEHLDHIIGWSIEQQNRMGYFATLYRQMTVAVQKGIANKVFNDGPRMELLDVTFANRYLQAWEAYVNHQPCSTAWCIAFDACSNNKLIVLQHLILGISTHINLDLAIAAAEACPGDKIYDLQSDFEKINTIISSLTETVQETLCRVWFPLRLLTKISNKRHEAVLNFSIEAARKASWASAVSMSVIQGEAKTNYIGKIDEMVAKVAGRVINPGFFTSLLIRLIRAMENRSVPKLIGVLKG